MQYLNTECMLSFSFTMALSTRKLLYPDPDFITASERIIEMFNTLF